MTEPKTLIQEAIEYKDLFGETNTGQTPGRPLNPYEDSIGPHAEILPDRSISGSNKKPRKQNQAIQQIHFRIGVENDADGSSSEWGRISSRWYRDASPETIQRSTRHRARTMQDAGRSSRHTSIALGLRCDAIRTGLNHLSLRRKRRNNSRKCFRSILEPSSIRTCW